MSTNDAETTVLTKTPAASPSLDPINPYAVISLVAALLGLFPVAIVFGILAFTRPAGRGIAIAGLVLGVLELAALLLAFFGVASAFTDDSESSAAQTVTSSVYAPFTATDETPSTSAPGEPSPTATTDTNESTTEAEPSPATGPVVNESCSQGQVNVLATDVDSGQSIVCAFSGENGDYKWVRTAPVSPGTHERGDSCDPASDQVGRTSAGTALLCVSASGGGGGSWEPGP